MTDDEHFSLVSRVVTAPHTLFFFFAFIFFVCIPSNDRNHTRDVIDLGGTCFLQGRESGEGRGRGLRARVQKREEED